MNKSLSPKSTSQTMQEEPINGQRVFWAAIIFSIVALISFVFSFFLINRLPAWQTYVISAITAVALAVDVYAVILIRRGQLEQGLKYLFWSTLLTVTPNAFLVTNTTPFLIGIVLAVSAVHLFYLQPRSWRRRYQFAPIIVTILMALVEVLQPSFRLDTGVGGTPSYFGPLILAFLIISLLLLISLLAWRGNIRLKIIIAFIVVAAVSLGILGTVTYVNYRNQIREDIRHRLLNMVNIIALQQDTTLHASIQNPGDEEADAYRTIRAINTAIITTEPELVYIYTLRMNEEGQIYFVVDTGQPGDEDTAAVAEVYDDASPAMIETFNSNASQVEEDFYTDEWGTFLSAYAPFYAEDGSREGVVGIDIAAETVLAREREVLNLILVTVTGAMVLVTLLGLWIGSIFTRPILELTSVAQRYSEGDLSAHAEVISADEIGTLATTFNTMGAQLHDSIVNLEQRVAERTKAQAITAQITTEIATIPDPLKMLETMVHRTQRGFELYHAHVFTYQEDKNELQIIACGYREGDEHEGTHGTTTIPMDAEQSLVARAARTRQPVIVNDVRNEPGWLPNPLLPETRAELAVPMIVGDRLLGVLDVQSERLDAFSEEDANVQLTLASQIAVALQNAQNFAEAEQARQDAQSIIDFATEGIAILDLETELWAEPNENFARTFGMSREEMAQTGPKVMSPPNQPDGRDSTEKAIEMINTAMEKGSHRFEWVHTKKDGSVFDCEIGLVRLPGDRPRLRQSIIDITERKRLEQDVAQRARQQTMLNIITQKIQSAATIEEAMQIAARELGNALGKRKAMVALDPTALSGKQKDDG